MNPSDLPTETTVSFDALGESDAFLEFQEKLVRVAAVDRPVLLMGERGTGKELAAKQLHYSSRRWKEALVALNCAALAPSLIESELFGHEPGAFTGALGRRRGRFETADGGTLFLDELGNIPLQVQEKILRTVEYGLFERVGGAEPVQVDVRIVGATNANLPALADQGRFMPDLLDRLAFEVLYLPPLRARKGDILLLARHFAVRMSGELGWTELPEFSMNAEAALEAHPWRGNVRELKNVIERAVFRAASPRIDAIAFDPFVSPWEAGPLPETAAAATAANVAAPSDFTASVMAFEARLVAAALEECRFNQRLAAQRLGLTYHQFRGLYRKYNM